MATSLRRASFFHLLWEKRNCTQEVSQAPWEAQHPLQGKVMKSWEFQKMAGRNDLVSLCVDKETS